MVPSAKIEKGNGETKNLTAGSKAVNERSAVFPSLLMNDYLVSSSISRKSFEDIYRFCKIFPH